MARSIRLAAIAAILLLLTVSISSARIQPRIVGGTAAAAGSAPFVVSLQRVTSSGNVHFCGGTILNSNWVVTAAHCLSSSSVVYNSVILAGSIQVNGGSSTAQTLTINYYVVNDLYVEGAFQNDIGLVHTPTAFVWSSAVQPASLPTAGVIPIGTASMFGWGSTSTSPTPATLQVAASVPILSLDTCKFDFGIDLPLKLHSTIMCTLSGDLGFCTSDSGGPLVQGNILIGIMSWPWGKVTCGQSNSPSVYVLVSAFTSWIASNQVVPS